MRTYETSHPWLKFELDLRPAPPTLWLILGEIRSKCEHIAGVPLDKKTAEQLYQLYLARGVQATTAIEGNTLTEEQVQQQIEGKLQLPPSMAYQGQEVKNIVTACNTILESVIAGKPADLTVALIKSFNGLVLAGLPLGDAVAPGAIRKTSVGVGSYRGAPAEDCEYLLERLCSFLKAVRERESGLDRVSISVLLAVTAHLYLAWIHPFGDGNGRTARLVEFLLLLDGGVPAPASHLLSNHYNQTRQSYYVELDRASGSGGEVVPFLLYALQGFVDGLKKQLDEIRRFQHKTIWRDYVNRILQTEGGSGSAEVRMRQRDLVVAISNREQFVPLSKVILLTPEIAQAYARKTRKTVSRDLNALRNLGLLEVSPAGVRARIETILAFLPPKKGT